MSAVSLPTAPGDFFRIKMTFERTDSHGEVLESASFGARLNPEGHDFIHAVSRFAANTVTTHLPNFLGEVK